MNVLFVSSEVFPFAKTGGLADVSGALPAELARQGEHVTVMTPAYRQTLHGEFSLEDTGVRFEVPIGAKTVDGSFLRGTLPGSSVPVYFVCQDAYYDRPQLYTENGSDYKDNCERFVFFCRAIMEGIRRLDLPVDLLHANDWQTALAIAYLKTELRGVPPYDGIAALYTIHNLAFQGQFWHWDMLLTGLDWKYYNWRQMEFFGKLNLMKTGIVFADAISTVSPRYAEEIQSAPLGCGLESLLQHRRDVLTGILNGVDYAQWNPQTDMKIAARYGVHDYRAGKAKCKRALQEQFGLPPLPDVPLVGMVGRLTDQKGLDLVDGVVTEWIHSSDTQWVVLGTGEPKHEELFKLLAQRYPSKVAARIDFSDAAARAIEAGADMFLMPSHFEPCGLNQMYSLKYGTVPVVRATGGLADTITDATETAIAAGTANGFSFQESSVLALSETLRRAHDVYRNRPDVWNQLITTGMKQDWSWSRSARLYRELYQRTHRRVHHGAVVG